VTVYKVEVNSAAGSQTSFEDAAGIVTDLRSLRDGSGQKFQFFSMANVTGGPFTSVSVTLGKDVTVFRQGASSGTALQFADTLDAGAGKSKLTLAFSSPKNLGTVDDRLIVDFDLANWVESAGKITPVLRESNGNGLNDDRRHVNEDYHGTVSGLTGAAPDLRFTLTQGGRSFQVFMDANTAVFNGNGDPNPVLANGKRVEVRGTFSIGVRALKATAVKIEGQTGNHPSEAKGAPQDVNKPAGTFKVKVRQASGFVPKEAVILVTTSANTVFRSRHGVRMTAEEFFAALPTAADVELEGTYNGDTNVFAAAKAKLDDDDDNGGGGGGGGHEAEAKGSVSLADPNAGTFSLTLSEWEGFNGSAGMKVDVTTNAQTEFLNKSGDVVDKAVFFAQIALTGKAEVKGSLTGHTLAAVRCKVED